MRFTQKLAASLLLPLGLAACQAPVNEFTDQDANAIRAQIETFVSSALAADWDAWGNTLSSDVVFFPPDQAPLVGRDAVMAWISEFPRLTSFTAPPDEVSGNGDLGFAHGTYSLTATLPDGSSLSEGGSYVDVFRRQPDGSWLYTLNIWHSNSPAPQPTM
jgi:ketosteroid isomerase-like protein